MNWDNRRKFSAIKKGGDGNLENKINIAVKEGAKCLNLIYTTINQAKTDLLKKSGTIDALIATLYRFSMQIY